jgi:hypothetical protein
VESDREHGNHGAGGRKVQVPAKKASLIERIIETYSPSGMGRLFIAQRLIGFAEEDLAAFERRRESGVAAPTGRFAIGADYRRRHSKFKLIAEEITAENNLSEVMGCSC